MNSFYLGIDIGGTNIRFVCYDTGTKKIFPIQKYAFLHGKDVKKEIDENLYQHIDEIISHMKQKNLELAGIGISLAANFDRKTGQIIVWPNNHNWDGFDIKSCLVQKYYVPIVLEDDANCAAVGEQLYGAGRGVTNFAYITVSTGIGCGIIIQDQLYIGEHGLAGELGHIHIVDDDTICTCGAKGCLQAKASGPAILRNFKNSTTYKNLAVIDDDLELKDVLKLARQENKEAKQVFLEAGCYIGKAIVLMVMLFDLPLIVLGGGVMAASDYIVEGISNYLNENLLNQRKVKLVLSELNDLNGTYGALSLIDQFINKKRTIEC